MNAFVEAQGGEIPLRPDVSDSTLSTLGGVGLEVNAGIGAIPYEID